MKPIARALIASATVTAIVVAASACDGDAAPCQVDIDCPQGTICREERCGPTSADASVPPDAGQPPVCQTEGASCNTPDECCTRVCTSNRCASSTPEPSPSCRGSLELCQDDCCAGFSCVSGVCR